MSSLSLIIEPPAITRASKSSADPELLKAMASQLSSEHWISDGQVYKTNKDASNALGLYRRVLPKTTGIAPHTLKTMTWGQDKKGNPVTDRNAPADWRFGIKLDPTRKPREHRTGTGKAGTERSA